MFIATNRFLIRKGFEEVFEERWRTRESHLHEFSGFLRFMLLRSEPLESGDVEFVSHSEWLSRDSFDEWRNSEQSKQSHGGNPLPKEAFLGPPSFRGYEAALEGAPDQRSDFRSAALDAKIEKVFSKESPAQQKIVKIACEAALPPIHVGPFAGQILELLLRSIGARRGIEIGTLTGYSTSWLAKALPAGGSLITIEMEANRATQARENMRTAGFDEIVEHRTGPALEVLRNLGDLRDLDFVFVDADKAGYGAYAEWALPRLRRGGLFIFDNAYLWGAMNYFGDPDEKLPQLNKEGNYTFSKAQFNGMSSCWDQLRKNPSFMTTIIPTGEGLGLAIKL